MGRDEMEKRFSAYLDRILAGEDVGSAPDLDEKHREDLEFARKMVSLRVTPSPAYQARLRADLLHQLAERDIKQHEKTTFLSRPFWRQPLWQGMTVVIFVVLMGVILWQAGVFPLGMGTSETTTPTTTTTTSATKTTATTTSASTTKPTATTTTGTYTTSTDSRLLIVTAGTDLQEYSAWDPVVIEVSLRNNSGGAMTLANLPPILSIMNAETREPVYTFGAGDVTLTLARNGETTFTYEWNQLDFNGQPATGRFYIELEDLEYNGLPLQLDLGQPVEFDILTTR